MGGYKGISGACSDEMGIGPVDTRSDQEGHAPPPPDMFERGGSVMGVCISLEFTPLNL